MNGRRVAVTGLGVITPVGIGIEETWSALTAGRGGSGPITRFDASDVNVRIAAEVRDFDPCAFIDAREVRRSDRFTHFATAAAALAAEHAGWQGLPYPRERVGVVIGSGIGGLGTLEAQHDVLRERGPSKLSPFAVPLLMINGAAGSISMRFGTTGPSYATASACASGGHAIADAAILIRAGVVDAMLAGGSEAGITPFALACFTAMGALSRRNDDPSRASRPFDADRDGFVLGEGAGVLALEDFESAERRGATILAELAGCAASSDAYHLTQPDPDGAGATQVMQAALADADLDASAVGYVNAHGTSTPYNDRVETAALRKVFAQPPPVSSTKSATGHLLGAAGAVEAAVTVMAVRASRLPPTINYETPDPECDLDYVPNVSRPAAVDVAMSNSFGFGGHNACLVFRSVG